MYRLCAVILNISRIRDNQTRIVMLSKEYGKITGWWNKKNMSGIDIGDVVEVFISRNENKNTIKNIEPLISGWNRNWNYIRIIAFLETLQIINNISLEGNPCTSIYNDITLLIEYGRKQEIHIDHYIIFQMRILQSLGYMDRSVFGDDPILGYIYDNVNHTPLERILSSSNIKKEHVIKIQQINLHSLYMLER